MITGTSHRFVFLDGLRGLAALTVVWGHAASMTPKPWPSAFGLAVDFFYMLSGFVIEHAYSKKLSEGMRFFEFVRVRVVRLYPMLFVGAVTGGSFLFASNMRHGVIAGWKVIVAAVLAAVALPNPFMARTFGINVPAWSLFFELAVNFVYALVARPLRTARLGAICIAVAATTAAFVVAASFYESANLGTQSLFAGFLRALSGFAFGVLVSQVSRPSRIHSAAAAMIALCLLLIFATPISTSWQVQLGIVIALFPVLLWLSASVSVRDRVATLCSWLGRISYPLYITHHPILKIVNSAIVRLGATEYFVATRTIASTLLCVGMSYVFLVLWDEPIRSRLGASRNQNKSAVEPVLDVIRK